ncbi:1089_t:CDS:2, partial [Paraglomus brasilianum]
MDNTLPQKSLSSSLARRLGLSQPIPPSIQQPNKKNQAEPSSGHASAKYTNTSSHTGQEKSIQPNTTTSRLANGKSKLTRQEAIWKSEGRIKKQSPYGQSSMNSQSGESQNRQSEKRSPSSLQSRIGNSSSRMMSTTTSSGQEAGSLTPLQVKLLKSGRRLAGKRLPASNIYPRPKPQLNQATPKPPVTQKRTQAPQCPQKPPGMKVPPQVPQQPHGQVTKNVTQGSIESRPQTNKRIRSQSPNRSNQKPNKKRTLIPKKQSTSPPNQSKGPMSTGTNKERPSPPTKNLENTSTTMKQGGSSVPSTKREEKQYPKKRKAGELEGKVPSKREKMTSIPLTSTNMKGEKPTPPTIIPTPPANPLATTLPHPEATKSLKELKSLEDADLLLNLGGTSKNIEDEVDFNEWLDFGLLGDEKGKLPAQENQVEEETAGKKEMTAEEMAAAVEAILEDRVESKEEGELIDLDIICSEEF